MRKWYGRMEAAGHDPVEVLEARAEEAAGDDLSAGRHRGVETSETGQAGLDQGGGRLGPGQIGDAGHGLHGGAGRLELGHQLRSGSPTTRSWPRLANIRASDGPT